MSVVVNNVSALLVKRRKFCTDGFVKYGQTQIIALLPLFSKWRTIWIQYVFLLSDPSTFDAGSNQNTSRIQVL